MTDRYRDALPAIAQAFETADQYATALEAVVDRVRELHQPIEFPGQGRFCDTCTVTWPCPTDQALDGI